MRRILSSRLLGIMLAFAVGVAAGATLRGATPEPFPSSANAPAEAPARVSIMLDFGDGTLKTFPEAPVAPGANLFSVLQERAATEQIPFAFKEYKGLGILVTKIGPKENGAGNRYWQYFVNNRHAEVGADAYRPRPGDVIEWKFIPALLQ